MDKPKLVISSAYASVLSVVFVTVITVWAELSGPVKSWLADWLGHHWVSKSVWSLIIYVAATTFFYFTIRQTAEQSLSKAVTTLLATTTAGIAIITAFYTGHHLGLF